MLSVVSGALLYPQWVFVSKRNWKRRQAQVAKLIERRGKSFQKRNRKRQETLTSLALSAKLARVELVLVNFTCVRWLEKFSAETLTTTNAWH